MTEEWKSIAGYENIYQISNYGNVKSSYSNKILKPQPNGKFGYYGIGLHINQVKHMKKIHRLVAEAFIPNPLGLPQVNHIDCDKSNNVVGNLEWCTQDYNMKHAKDNNLLNPRLGENHGRHILTQENVNKIRSLTGKINKSKLAREYGVHPSTINRVITNVSWNHI